MATSVEEYRIEDGSGYQRYRVGDYLVLGNPGDYQIMEQCGAHRITSKRFKTLTPAIRRAEALNCHRQTREAKP